MNVLHLASFNGNIGDNANHNGFRKGFEEVFTNVTWTELEIRYFYKSWSKLKFDNNFSETVNKYDVLIIGGGNFFEICHDYSSTGCTIDLCEKVLNTINIPIFFNALGFDTHKGATPKNAEKFKKFITNIAQKNNSIISFRNDGSIENYKKTYGKVEPFIHKIPDGGFFITPSKIDETQYHKQIIGINLACDMIGKRLVRVNYFEFLLELKEVYSQLIQEQKNYTLRFFPHILSDLKIIYDLLALFDDQHIKFNVEVMPYITGQGSEKLFFEKYKQCQIVTGMRFHSNVCAFGMGIKTIPLVTYPKLKALYKDLNQEEMLIDVNDKNFKKNYRNKINKLLSINYNNDEIIENLRQKQKQVIEKFKVKLT